MLMALQSSSSEIARWGVGLKESEERDDLTSEWNDVKASGGVWGGRKRGGQCNLTLAGVVWTQLRTYARLIAM